MNLQLLDDPYMFGWMIVQIFKGPLTVLGLVALPALIACCRQWWHGRRRVEVEGNNKKSHRWLGTVSAEPP